MKTRPLLAPLLGLLAAAGTAWADDAVSPPAVISTATSNDYSEVTCTCSDDLAAAETLQLAADTRDQMAPLLLLKPHWLFPVHIHIITPDDPLADQIREEGVQVIADGKSMRIEAVLPSTDPDAREFIQRQFVTAILWEKFFCTGQTFDSHTRLDVVPLWLVEGLREWLNEDSEHSRENIVRKAAQNNRAPTLEEITSWKDLSTDRLLGLWQRAFCFYLVNSLIEPGPKRDNFQDWLATFSGANPTSPKLLFPTESGWQRELADAANRSQDIVYTWDDTLARLSAAETIAVPGKTAADTRICTLFTVATFPHSQELDDALKQKIFDLTNLELRAHPSWRPILKLYRFGLTSLIGNVDHAKGRKMITDANEQQVAEMDFHQKLTDYMNWFEVTRDYAGNSSQFRSYFWTAQQMERIEADPAHPNPIRTSLLRVESQL